MKKAYINSLDNNEKLAATNYAIEVHHKDGEVVELERVQYSYQDVFESISEYYADKNDGPVDKIVIQVKK